VKFLESSGEHVVPIFDNLTEVETKKLFESINGAVFPGGIVNVLSSGYTKILRTILKLAKKTFDEGGCFPIIGMCLGHQILAIALRRRNKCFFGWLPPRLLAPLIMTMY
jgi:gamma-glutamyl hydrolase